MASAADDLRAKIESIGAGSAGEIVPLVYAELKKLAGQQLRAEPAGQTLQATALVHEAYLRILGPSGADAVAWDGRGHFFAAVAEAMRRILVDRARARGAAKRGGGWKRIELDLSRVPIDEVPSELLDLDAALSRMAEEAPEKAELVRLRFFAGLTSLQAAQVLGISVATADRHWSYARAWLFAALGGEI